MSLLNWDGINEGPSSYTLRRVVENMHEVSALVEMLGVLLTLDGHRDDYEEGLALELVADAGHLAQALGKRALELLDTQAAPGVPPPTRKRRQGPRLVGVAADGSLAISRARATSQTVPGDGA